MKITRTVKVTITQLVTLEYEQYPGSTVEINYLDLAKQDALKFIREERTSSISTGFGNRSISASLEK